ncbi:MAG: D-glucuronyl C5-epimerase domain protein [Solirubrobacterales bacterium]|nr:D-glucuronyl C5-epimerase domain protein [Solirubrobacterales bacterium]
MGGAPTPPGQSRLNSLLSIDFGQPVSPRLDLDRPRGYYLDLSVKAPEPVWPPPWHSGPPALWVKVIQYGLGCLERHVESRAPEWLAAAASVGEYLVAAQQSGDGPRRGAWLHHRPLPHTYELPEPWISAMAQGEGASLLVRLHDATGQLRFGDAAVAALVPMRVLTEEGGASAALGTGQLPQEYPTRPPSHVLNGAVFALWGFRDVAVGLGDARARTDFEEGAATLARNIHRWDTGRWSRYDLFPHARVNVASPAYHRLHIDQLTVMDLVAPDDRFRHARERYEEYARSTRLRAEALAAKVQFRLGTSRRSGGAVSRARTRP